MMNIEVENKEEKCLSVWFGTQKKVWEKECLNFHDYLDRDYLLGMTLFSLFFHDSSIHFSYSIYTSFHNQPTGMAPGMVNPKSSFSGTKVTEETRNMIRHFDERQKNLKVFCQDDDGLLSIAPSSMKEGKRKSLLSNKESQKFKKKKLLHTEIDVCWIIDWHDDDDVSYRVG